MEKSLKLFLLFLFFTELLFSNSVCVVEKDLLVAYAKNERHSNRYVGYPYMISFNEQKESKILREEKILDGYGKWLDSRTFDCKNEATCKAITTALVKNGIKNMDLGHMQICYKWHPLEVSEYFDIQKSEQRACRYLVSLTKQYGWSWETIGKYHSFTKDKNEAYYKKIQKNL